MIAAWLSENGGAGALRLIEVPEMGLRRRDASWPLCVVASCVLPMVGKGMSSFRLENGAMVPPSMGDMCPDLAHQYTAMLPFASVRVVAGCADNAAQLDVLAALR